MLRKEQGQYQVETPAYNSPLFCGDIEVEVVRNLPNEKRNGLGLSANSRRRSAIALLLVYPPRPDRAGIKGWVAG